MILQQEISKGFNDSLLNKEFDCLVESKQSKGGFFVGRTYMDAPEVDGEVLIHAKNLKIGEFTKVRIVDSMEYDLVAKSI